MGAIIGVIHTLMGHAKSLVGAAAFVAFCLAMSYGSWNIFRNFDDWSGTGRLRSILQRYLH